jgi:hypothetical protein
VGIYETHSKRLKKREQAGQPDVYQFDEISWELRVQITHIWDGTIGSRFSNTHHYSNASPNVYDFIERTLCREMGVFSLTGDPYVSSEKQCKHLLLHGSTLETLDVIEISFRLIKGLDDIYSLDDHPPDRQRPEDAVKELNYRFRESGVGYQFEGGQIVRVDSQYVHAAVTKPAIALLNTAGFEGASDKFLKAHEHYCKGRLAEAINEALKAFESTMKAICDKNGWKFDSNAPAKRLIEVIVDNELVPRYMQSHFTGLRQTLEAGLPTLRNKNSGHGQGAQAKKIPQYFAGYALHLAATNIVFLVEAHESLDRE